MPIMDVRIPSANRGLTLIELVIVILIISIVSVIAIPKWTVSSMGLEFDARRVLNDIRYAQVMSMTSGQRYRWVMLSSTSYQVTNQAGTAIVLPSGGTVFTLGAGNSFGSLTNLPNSLVAFDSQGVPYSTSGVPGTALASGALIPLVGGGGTRTVGVSQQTGYGVLQ